MATTGFCYYCSKRNKFLSAIKYCVECKERLCSDCAETHDWLKSFKYHNFVDLSSVGSDNLTFAMKHCNFHSDKVLYCYCTDHQRVCCRNCIRHNHRKCQNVLPLEHASKDVKDSALFFDVVQNMKHMIKTLADLIDNRESNLQRLAKTKLDITKQISKVKSRLLKQIDNLELDLHADIRKHEIEINKQKEEISQVLDSLKETCNEIDFLQDYESTNQLFVVLHQQETITQSTDTKVSQLVSNSQEIDIIFDEMKEIKFESFEPISKTLNPCQVQYTSMKFLQAQIIAEPTKRFVEFQKDTKLKLELGYNYNITDLSITADNKLLLANCSSIVSKLFVYSDCKNYETSIYFFHNLFGVAVIPGTHRAVVTLSSIMSIQFINTTQMTKGNIVNVRFECCGITAGRDKIYVGGTDGTIKTLDNNGTILKSIKKESGIIFFILHDEIHEQFIIRCHNKLFCVNFDGTQVYSTDVSGVAGVTRDELNNLYFGDYHTNKIQRLSADWKNCTKVLNQEDGINHTYGMCFNNDFTKLFVVNNSLKSVFVYKSN